MGAWKWGVGIVSILVVAVLSSSANAQTIVFDGSSLPSQQGWQYNTSGLHSGVAETAVYSVEAGGLEQNTIGQPFGAGGGSARYERAVPFSNGRRVRYTVNVQVLGYEEDQHPFGFQFGIDYDGGVYSVGLADDRVRPGSFASDIVFPTTSAIRTYRIEGVLGGEVELFVDSAKLANVEPSFGPQPQDQLRFGDSTGLANAQVLIQEVRFEEAAGSNPSDLVVDFGSLPSTQTGWRYVASGINFDVPESQVFSLASGTLVQDSIGEQFGAFETGANRYEYPFPEAIPDEFEMVVEARTLALEGDSFGFQFGVDSGAETFSIALYGDRVVDGLGAEATLDTSGFRTYRLVGQAGVGYELYVDGSLFMSGQGRLDAVPVSPRVRFGDSTGTGNAHAEVSAVRYASPPRAGVPAIGVVGLAVLACGLGAVGSLAVRARRLG